MGREHRRELMRRFLARFTPLLPDTETARLWARIKSGCEKKGRPITFADAWIAAAPLQLKVPLVSQNASDYGAVENLTILTATRQKTSRKWSVDTAVKPLSDISRLTGLPASIRSAWRSSPACAVQSRLDRETRTRNRASPDESAVDASRAGASRASQSFPRPREPVSPYPRASCSSGMVKETPSEDDGSSPWAMRSAITSMARRSALLIASSRVWP